MGSILEVLGISQASGGESSGPSGANNARPRKKHAKAPVKKYSKKQFKKSHGKTPAKKVVLSPGPGKDKKKKGGR